MATDPPELERDIVHEELLEWGGQHRHGDQRQ